MDINGIWTGTIIYQDGYPDSIIGKELTFDLTITESDGDILGNGNDVSGFGLNPTGFTIKGFVEDSMISFVKQYNSAAYFDLNNNVIFVENEPSAEIIYNGVYNDDGTQFEGEWYMVIEQIPDGDGWLDSECTGTWVMKKN